MNTLEATSFEEQLSVGSTRPFLVTCVDTPYVCKLYEEDLGNLHVINEFICYHLGVLFGLPLPQAKLIRINEEIVKKNANLSERGIRSTLAFGSKWEKGVQTKINPPLLDSSTNNNIIPNLVLFDQFVFNVDRATNDGNLLFNTRNRNLIVIDHTHAFPGQTIWNSQSLKTEQNTLLVPNFHLKYYKMLIRYINGNSPFHDVQTRITKITRTEIKQIIDAIPQEWNFTNEQQTCIIDFLTHRLQLIPKILEAISKECPQWKGGI